MLWASLVRKRATSEEIAENFGNEAVATRGPMAVDGIIQFCALTVRSGETGGEIDVMEALRLHESEEIGDHLLLGVYKGLRDDRGNQYRILTGAGIPQGQEELLGEVTRCSVASCDRGLASRASVGVMSDKPDDSLLEEGHEVRPAQEGVARHALQDIADFVSSGKVRIVLKQASVFIGV